MMQNYKNEHLFALFWERKKSAEDFRERKKSATDFWERKRERRSRFRKWAQKERKKFLKKMITYFCKNLA